MSALSDLVQERAGLAVVTTIYPGHDRDDTCDDWQLDVARDATTAALSVLADPEVLQGIAEVLGGAIHGCFDGKPGLYDEPCEQCWTAAEAVVAALTGTKP